MDSVMPAPGRKKPVKCSVLPRLGERVTYRNSKYRIRQTQHSALPIVPMTHHTPVKMAATDDRRHTRQKCRVCFSQQPHIGVNIREVDGAVEGTGPVGPGCVEVRMRDQDKGEAA